MKKLAYLLLLIPSIAFGNGPRYTYTKVHGLDDEMNNIYHDIKYPVCQYAIMSVFQSASTNTATTGVIRLANGEILGWRNAANSADITFNLNSGNSFAMTAPLIINPTSSQLTLGSAGGANSILITAPTPAASRTYTIGDAGASANFILGTTNSVITAPTVQKFTSGTATYTRPSNPTPIYIRVRMVGGGGGGAGSGTASSSSNGSTGGNSTFGTTLLVANGGVGGTWNGNGGAGGTASLGTGPIGTALSGGQGQGYGYTGGAGGPIQVGGCGAASPFGGAGGGGSAGVSGYAAIANSGSGGGGGATTTTAASVSGPGGGSGGYVDAIITSPASSYAYAVGGNGSAGAAGTSGNSGGAGGSGYIEVQEFYQ